jgi:hypothetical protein
VRVKDAVGKKIVAVEQSEQKNSAGDTFLHLEAIRLSDGTTISFGVMEMEGDYGVRSRCYVPQKAKLTGKGRRRKTNG